MIFLNFFVLYSLSLCIMHVLMMIMMMMNNNDNDIFIYNSEIAMDAKVIVNMAGAKTTLLDPSGATPPRDFTFDFSYWSFDSAAPNFATNPKVYSDLGVSVLNNAWEGYNCCLFAY